MLSIRMQRIGRKGHPTYRVVVQDSRWAPTSGRFVAQLGSYDPHTKTATLVKEKAELYLQNGAQPSERVVKLLTSEGVKLPNWVKAPNQQNRQIKNIEKLRRNRPAEEKVEEPVSEIEVEAPSEAIEEVAVAETGVPAEEPAIKEAADIATENKDEKTEKIETADEAPKEKA